MSKTVKCIGMDLPIIAELTHGWYLAAHPNGACIANENAITVLWGPPMTTAEDGRIESQGIRDQAIEAFERFAWTRLKAEFYPETVTHD